MHEENRCGAICYATDGAIPQIAQRRARHFISSAKFRRDEMSVSLYSTRAGLCVLQGAAWIAQVSGMVEQVSLPRMRGVDHSRGSHTTSSVRGVC
jgi:hypothetical protein